MQNDLKEINPFALGAAFLQHCIKERWIIHKVGGKMHIYYVTPLGQQMLGSPPYDFTPDKYFKRTTKTE